ncbi:MAG TPA: S66 peptidase family protein [Candidatus Latescibacteria bacterium]|jgi:muramoyltetrapeptide carboxypeptidase LdcA involved in peptidoglycan recycling|nr:LD-carboxypeptidase [Candidatus Latescibacterota bacterium]HJP30390.1 S66 peptidase family protein [Candidatus Latescibacterota bacterium]
MIKPPRLSPGDTVGLVSPSWGGMGAVPHRTERDIEHLRRLGFEVRLADNALHQSGDVSDSPERRTADLHQMFADPEIKAIVAGIGGDHSCHLLPHLDFELIAANPKILVGYSDITVLNVAIWSKTGLITFNGPALLTDFAEYPAMFDYTEEHFLKAVGVPRPMGRVEPSPWWTEEFLQWGDQTDLTRPRERQPSPGWTWLKPGEVEGPLIGGCLESLQHLRGTPWWPCWEGAILFFETSEEKPSPAKIDGILMDYENMGVFDSICGLVVGRPMKYSDEEKSRLRQVILERTAGYAFPILTDVDFGHTAPQITIPLGCRARIDTPNEILEILEAAVL